MKTILEYGHGLHEGVVEGVYHQRHLGLVSKHALDLIRRSPAHYKAWIDGAEEPDADELRFGRAFHCALLEPDRFAIDHVVAPDFGDCRKKENKANRDAWREANKGSVWMEADEHAAAMKMAHAIRVHSRASRLISGGRSEMTARWKDEATGLECKARADYYVPEHRLIVDVKTAENASFSAFQRAVANYGYHRQAALYRDGFSAAGTRIEHFVFVVVEKAPPFAVAAYALDADAIAAGTASVREDMAKLADCVARDAWAAYPEEIQVMGLPAWAA